MNFRPVLCFLKNSHQCFLRSLDVPKFYCISHVPKNVGTSLHARVFPRLEKHNPNSVLRRHCYTFSTLSKVSEESPASPEVVVSGHDVPKPCTSFSDNDLAEHILLELQHLGFNQPTLIQEHCLPVALTGRDMVGIGQTGSGKTLAYILPALVHIDRQKTIQTGAGPVVLILAPTRELVQQIQEVVLKFRDICRIRSVCLYGGVSKGPQIQHLEKGVHVCIATPGRLIDLAEMGAVNLSQVSYLVLDEADRMLDMGFEPQVRKIVKGIPSKHQTLMWSATWPEEIRDLARQFMHDVVHVAVGSTDLTANPNITQNVHVCSQMDKPERFVELLQKILSERHNKVLVFAQTKVQVDIITRNLVWKKIPAASIHGDKSQLQRDRALNDFRRNNVSVLIATDVAARGLDITDITHIINYDFPVGVETYVHRIGRTARAERTGTAHSFFTPDNAGLARDLVDVLVKCNQNVDPQLMVMAQQPRRKTSSFSFRGDNSRRSSSNQNIFTQARYGGYQRSKSTKKYIDSLSFSE